MINKDNNHEQLKDSAKEFINNQQDKLKEKNKNIVTLSDDEIFTILTDDFIDFEVEYNNYKLLFKLKSLPYIEFKKMMKQQLKETGNLQLDGIELQSEVLSRSVYNTKGELYGMEKLGKLPYSILVKLQSKINELNGELSEASKEDFRRTTFS